MSLARYYAVYFTVADMARISHRPVSYIRRQIQRLGIIAPAKTLGGAHLFAPSDAWRIIDPAQRTPLRALTRR